MLTRPRQFFLAIVITSGLTACASIPESLVSRPDVELNNVQVMGLGFKGQTFLLTFDVANPNGFSLPVHSVGYAVTLDGERFASGETESNFVVPAGGATQFSISVDLNLLQTAPQLLSIVRDSTRGDVPYELEGVFGIDLPLSPSVSYRNRGLIRLRSDSL